MQPDLRVLLLVVRLARRPNPVVPLPPNLHIPTTVRSAPAPRPPPATPRFEQKTHIPDDLRHVPVLQAAHQQVGAGVVLPVRVDVGRGRGRAGEEAVGEGEVELGGQAGGGGGGGGDAERVGVGGEEEGGEEGEEGEEVHGW